MILFDQPRLIAKQPLAHFLIWLQLEFDVQNSLFCCRADEPDNIGIACCGDKLGWQIAVFDSGRCYPQDTRQPGEKLIWRLHGKRLEDIVVLWSGHAPSLRL